MLQNVSKKIAVLKSKEKDKNLIIDLKTLLLKVKVRQYTPTYTA